MCGAMGRFSGSVPPNSIIVPDDKLCVVVLNNVIPTRSEQIGLELADIVLGQTAKPATDLK